MVKIKKLYRPFHLKKNYGDIPEESILSYIYQYQTGTIEEVVSQIINEAVLAHMHVYIDSTIMQILALNEYLTSLFIANLETLVFNYMIHYFEEKQIEEISEELLAEIEQLACSVNMKYSLEVLVSHLNEYSKVIHK